MERAKMPIGYFRAIHVVICLPGLTVTGDPFGVTCHRRRFEMTNVLCFALLCFALRCFALLWFALRPFACGNRRYGKS